MRNNIFFISLFTILAISFTARAQEDTIKYNGSVTILRAIMYKTAAEFNKETGIKLVLKGNGTEIGIEKVLSGECDIAGGSRPLKENEKQKGLVEIPIFQEAFAFIVNPKNNLQTITPEQLSNIMHGTTTNWSQIGGNSSAHIRVITPPEDSPHFQDIKKQIGFQKSPQGATVVASTPDVASEIVTNTGGIGWLSYASVKNSKKVKILDLMINGQQISINEDSVRTGEYPYSQTMYFYTTRHPAEKIKEFMSFMHSEHGEQIVHAAGFFHLESHSDHASAGHSTHAGHVVGSSSIMNSN